MLSIGTIVLGVDDLLRARAFWMAALDYGPRDPGDDTFVVLVPPDGAGTHLALDLSETPVQEHPRVHLDRPHDFVVLADTEGNRFCVIDKGFTG